MKKLKEMVEQNDSIWMNVGEQDKVVILRELKAIGCTWISGEEIDPFGDSLGHFIGVGKGMILGKISAMCWCNSDRAKYMVGTDLEMTRI